MANNAIGTLIEALNAKAQAAGCAARAEYMTIDRTWGDKCGIAILGGTIEDRERCARYAALHFERHISRRRTCDTQFSFGDCGERQLVRGSRFDGREWIVDQAGPLYDPSSTHGADKYVPFAARVIGLVYYPCAD